MSSPNLEIYNIRYHSSVNPAGRSIQITALILRLIRGFLGIYPGGNVWKRLDGLRTVVSGLFNLGAISASPNSHEHAAETASSTRCSKY